MKLDDLIDSYLSSTDEAHGFTAKKGIGQTKIDSIICNFLTKLQNGSEITSQEFNKFSEEASRLSINVNRSIIRIAFNIATKIYKQHETEIKMTTDVIEKQVNESHQISQEIPNAKKYIDLINAYRLLVSTQNKVYIGELYPGVPSDMYDTLTTVIPFSINALTLTGKLPKSDYNGVNTANPLYPLNLQVIKGNKLPIKKGIKVSDEYFPYKSVSKIAKGDTGDNTFLATNGSKILFMRGVKDYAPQGILASKIATLVSPKHFSSERLMDNKIVASRGLNTYACSVADPKTSNARKQYIETDKKVFPGTGIIDEVTNFCIETDPNTENLGLSSTKIEEAHLSKIDFDRCLLSSSTYKNGYEKDIVSRPSNGIYHALKHVQLDPAYIHEKLYARLKLSMITEPLLRSLADKAFMDKDQQTKEKSIIECSKRSDIALELFWEHKEAEQFILKNPEILNQCYTEITLYIKGHFRKKDQPKLLSSLLERVELISSKLTEKLGVKKTNPQTLKMQPLEKEEEQSTLEKRKKFINVTKRKINKILNALERKIGRIDQHHFAEAHKEASELLKSLRNSEKQYLINLEDLNVTINTANQSLENQCKAAIDKARPVLERDLGWDIYLTNILKEMANAVILALSFGQAGVNRFFKPERAKSIEIVEEAVEEVMEEIVEEVEHRNIY